MLGPNDKYRLYPGMRRFSARTENEFRSLALGQHVTAVANGSFTSGQYGTVIIPDASSTAVATLTLHGHSNIYDGGFAKDGFTGAD